MKGLPAVAPRHLTLCDALDHAAATAGARLGSTFVSLSETEHFQSWQALAHESRRVAAALRRGGVGPGDRVALLLRTGPAFLETFYGVLRTGAIPVPLYPPVRLGRLDDYHLATSGMLSRVGAKLVVSEGALARLLGPSLERARPPLGLRLVADLKGSDEWSTPGSPDDTALIQFSSGSTVDPKPVCLTHRQLTTHTATLQALARPSSADVYVSWLPLYHDMGLIGALLTTIDYPGPLVLIPPEVFLAKPAIWLRAISRHRGTISGAPNFAYGLCLKRIAEADLEGLDLSSWRLAFNGAELVSAEVARRFSSFFGRFGLPPTALRPVYGLSEAALALTFPPEREELRTVHVDRRALAEGRASMVPGDFTRSRELVSVGAPIPGVSLSLRSDSGSEVPVGSVGRIFATGPSIMQGYFGDSDGTAAALLAGRLDTGDLGVEVQGELYIVGRVKDVVILRGANHAPQEFEDALEGVAGLRVGCAVALGFVPADADGEQLLVLAEWSLRPDDPARLETVIAAAILARTGIAPHTIALLAPGTLPRTSSGKLRRAAALRAWVAGRLTPPDPVTPLRLAVAMARSAVSFARLRWRRGT